MTDCEAARKIVREHLESLADLRQEINMDPIFLNNLGVARDHIGKCREQQCVEIWQELHGAMLRVEMTIDRPKSSRLEESEAAY